MRTKIGIFLVVISLLTLIGTLITLIFLVFQNPDLTNMRFIYTYPQPIITTFISGIIFRVSIFLIDNK